MSSATRYEIEFAQYLKSGQRAFAFWKGRVALFAILKALSIGPKDEVIIPGFTCVVVPNVIRLAGARPVYVDIADNSYNIDPLRLSQAITSNTRAIVVQHTFGIPACIDEIITFAKGRNLYVIEDCAHALGSIYAGRPVGLWGDASFFSTQWSKPFTTGLGGVAVTKEATVAEKLAQVQLAFHPPPLSSRFKLELQYWFYRTFYSPRIYWQAQAMLRLLGHYGILVGSSSHLELEGQFPKDHEWLMPPAQQVHGIHQLQKMGSLLNIRQMLGHFYDQRLSKAGWPQVQRSDGTTMLRYPVLVNNKRELLEQARNSRIELGSWFESPLHPIELERHHNFGYSPGQCPNAERTARKIVNLPMHDRITTDEAGRIVNFLVKYGDRL